LSYYLFGANSYQVEKLSITEFYLTLLIGGCIEKKRMGLIAQTTE
jgi:hypothetical protein